MKRRMIEFFKPPECDSIEREQKARFLHVALIVNTCACIILGVLNIPGQTHLDIYLFISAGISLISIPFNKHGYYMLVAFFIAGLLLAIITYSLVAGVGLKDAGLIAYPIFIIFSSYLFSKKSVFFTTLLSLGSVILVYYLEEKGYINPVVRYTNEGQLKVILVLLLAAGFLFWVVVDNWENIAKNLKESYDITLTGWGQALEYRDHETEGHSRRVVEMTISLAKQLGIPAGKLEHIRRGALLHDIGKIAVPDSLLFKKGDLLEEEWEIVKRHPVLARKLLENIPYLKPALAIPYSHHERWDGSGYPEGLLKEDIPIFARIFAVVDVWDALTSDRPYRQAWSKEKTCDFFRDQAGKLFDPRVVKAFLALIEKNK